MQRGAAGARGWSSWSRQSTPGPWLATALVLLVSGCGTSGGSSSEAGPGDVSAGDLSAPVADAAADATSASDSIAVADTPAAACDAAIGCMDLPADASPADAPLPAD